MTNIVEGMIPCVTNRVPVMGSLTDVIIEKGEDLKAFFKALPTTFAREKAFDIGWYNPETDDLIVCGRFENGQRCFRIFDEKSSEYIDREGYFDKFVQAHLACHYEDPKGFMSWNNLESLYKVQFADPANDVMPRNIFGSRSAPNL